MAQHPHPEVAAEVVELIDPTSLVAPRGHGANYSFKPLAKRLWFDSMPDLSVLYGAFQNLCLYGLLDRAVPAALALRGVPNGTPMVMYGYLNSCVCMTCCHAERAGNAGAAAALRELAVNSPGETYLPKPRALDGSMLHDVFSDPGTDPSWRAGEALNDIATLCDMWVFGTPSPEWTRERIGAKIDETAANILSLPKWRPWLTRA